ncbi:MAG TPA: Hsp70 family protein [Pilimelia sp.]|nr:Hsp70 family protein [Pilimelia sp.]
MTAPLGGYTLGVDLGTSNTVAVLRWPDGRTRPLLFDSAPVLPSGVFLDAAGRFHVGRDAQRLAQADPGRYEPHPKRHIDHDTILLGDAEVSTVDVLAAVLGALARAAVEATGFVPPAVLTYPASWGARRREVLAAAVARAGWPPVAAGAGPSGHAPGAGPAAVRPGGPAVRDAADGGPPVPAPRPGEPGAVAPVPVPGGTLLVPEPVAAARYFAEVLRRPVPVGGALAVFDFGGGTLDVAVVRNVGTDPAGRAEFAVAGSGGLAELGGLDLDAALVGHLGRVLAGSAPQAWHRLHAPATAAEARDRWQFWQHVREAKEMLSRAAVAPVPVPGVDQAAHLTREEFEELAAPLLRRAVRETGRVLAGCRLAPGQLAGLFLVGGSSRVPLVARMLHAELGIAPTVLEQPELPVAEGALAHLPSVVASAAAALGDARAAGRAAVQVTGAVGAPPAPRTAPAGALGGSAPASVPAPGSAAAAATAPGGTGPGGVGPGGVGPGGPDVPVPGPVDGPPGGGLGAAPRHGSAPAPVAASTPWHRRGGTWLAAGVASVVLAGSGVALWLTRGPSEIDFQDVAVVARIPTGDERPSYAFTHVLGDRAVLAWQRGEQLEIVTADADSGAERWRRAVPGSAAQWKGVVAYPDALLAIADGSGDEPGTAYVLDPETGVGRWQREVADDDQLLVYDSVAVHVDTGQHRLVGLDLRSGAERWEWAFPRTDSGRADATVLPAVTVADLAGPAGADGVPLATRPDDDRRVVVVGADQRARVIDARSGTVLAERGNVGDPGSGRYLAYDGRLFVAGAGDGYGVSAYELDGLGEPRSVYQSADERRALHRLAPCGPGRVCVLDTRAYDSSTMEVAGIDAAKGGQRWRHPAAEADELLPVGESVLVQRTGGEVGWVLRDRDGAEVLRRDGFAVRVDAANLLSVVGGLTSGGSDLSVAGVGARSGTATELGPLQQGRGGTCTWNTEVVACMGEEKFILWRFAAG